MSAPPLEHQPTTLLEGSSESAAPPSPKTPVPHQAPLRAIVFDVDGVLRHFEHNYPPSLDPSIAAEFPYPTTAGAAFAEPGLEDVVCGRRSDAQWTLDIARELVQRKLQKRLVRTVSGGGGAKEDHTGGAAVDSDVSAGCGDAGRSGGGVLPGGADRSTEEGGADTDEEFTNDLKFGALVARARIAAEAFRRAPTHRNANLLEFIRDFAGTSSTTTAGSRSPIILTGILTNATSAFQSSDKISEEDKAMWTHLDYETLTKDIDVVVNTAQEGCRKPDEAIFLRLLQRLNDEFLARML